MIKVTKLSHFVFLGGNSLDQMVSASCVCDLPLPSFCLLSVIKIRMVSRINGVADKRSNSGSGSIQAFDEKNTNKFQSQSLSGF